MLPTDCAPLRATYFSFKSLVRNYKFSIQKQEKIFRVALELQKLILILVVSLLFEGLRRRVPLIFDGLTSVGRLNTLYCSQHEDITMRNLDFSPLYRSSIGFDRMAGLLDNLTRAEQTQPSYPPYNIELTGEDQYRISMAVAGFEESEVDIEVKQNNLTVTGHKQSRDEGRTFLHQGIAARNFERRFQLADYVRVEDASMINGLLHVNLVREIPEAMKPRTIAINTSAQANSSRLARVNENGAESDRVEVVGGASNHGSDSVKVANDAA